MIVAGMNTDVNGILPAIKKKLSSVNKPLIYIPTMPSATSMIAREILTFAGRQIGDGVSRSLVYLLQLDVAYAAA